MTVSEAKQKTTEEFKKWVGYTEKKSAAALAGHDYDNPGDYNEGAGDKNFTVFSNLYYEKTGIDVRGCAWCDCFIDTVFIHLYGVSDAKKMLGGFSAYTPTSSNYFKKMNLWFTEPEYGDIIFFKNTERIYHTGYVYKVTATKVYTIEGNTSSGDNTVVENGGCVAMKSYDRTYERIAGYGRPKWDVVATGEKKTYEEKWMKAADNVRWWYQFKDGSYALNDGKNNGWYRIGDYWYAFDAQGYMLTGLYTVGNDMYYLYDKQGSAMEGRLMATYGNNKGALTCWNLAKHPAESL